MPFKMQEVLPVVLSIIVIILVAIFEKQSKLVAAITATMPLGIPLALWIVYSSSSGDQEVITRFNFSMLLSFIPTLAFVITVWLAAKSGFKLGSMLVSGYAVWALGAGLLFLLRRSLGLG